MGTWVLVSPFGKFQLLGSFFGWTTDQKKKIKEEDHSSDLEKKNSMLLLRSRLTHLRVAQGIGVGNGEPRYCSSDFRSLHELDQCYSNGSSSPCKHTLLGHTVHLFPIYLFLEFGI